MVNIKKTKEPKDNNSLLFIGNQEGEIKNKLTREEYDYLCKQVKNEKEIVVFNRYSHLIIFVSITKDKKKDSLEDLRVKGFSCLKYLESQKTESLCIETDKTIGKECILAFTEGLSLSSYRFLKYLTKANEHKSSLQNILLCSDKVSEQDITELKVLVEQTCKARDLINEPGIYLNTLQLEKSIKEYSRADGFSLQVLDKESIEKLKMGGLLAVNKGSIDPPRFFIMEWKPENPKNKKPYVIIGKGITFDTGGLSLKPGSFMEDMKSDMSGAATVIGAISAISKNKLPLHVIALVPATDNRPGGNAITPGDIITMHDETTVEVLNTDAEGRLILADALAYAKQFDPALVIDLATLTGAASRAIGKYAIVGMHNTQDGEFNKLKESGNKVYERIVEFPLWDDYKDLIKSKIADIKNIGGIDAGAITAGKFLEHFTDYPFIHLDIAGPAFVNETYSYRGNGGTGVGVRLLYHFFKTM